MPRSAHSRLTSVALAALFAGLTTLAVPFASRARTVLVPGVAELDAILGTLLIAEGGDTLLRQPSAFYDLAILQPDVHQRRSLEPFLGYVVAGLPFRAAGLDAARTFEAVRWLVVFAALCYAWRLLRWLDCDRPLSAAGAALVALGPSLLHGIERPQVLAIALAPALVVHAVQARERRHALALGAWLVLYPLLGMYNAIAVAVAAVLTWPLIARLLIDRWRARDPVLPMVVVLAAAVEAILLFPWLTDRADLAGYVDPAFLAIKHWNALDLPGETSPTAMFVRVSLGLGWLAALGLALVSGVAGLRGGARRRAPGVDVLAFALAPAVAAAIVARRLWWPEVTPGPAWALAFQIAALLSLAVFWRRLWVSDLSTRDGIAATAGWTTAGLGVFLCLLAFGPRAASNASLLSGLWAAGLVELFPPLARGA